MYWECVHWDRVCFDSGIVCIGIELSWDRVVGCICGVCFRREGAGSGSACSLQEHVRDCDGD